MIFSHRSKNESKKIQAKLKYLLKASVSLIITDNTRSIIAVRKRNHAYIVRLHHMFLDADESALVSLSGYISGHSNHINKTLRNFIKEHGQKIRKPSESRKPRRTRIMPQGSYFDLQASFERLNQNYFEGRVDCPITWGNRRKWSGQQSIRLGSYSPKSKIIRISHALDRSFVPGYVVDDVVYHEMLHHLLDVKRQKGRKLYHHEAFRKMEKNFIRRENARLWIKENLSRLLCDSKNYTPLSGTPVTSYLKMGIH